MKYMSSKFNYFSPKKTTQHSLKSTQYTFKLKRKRPPYRGTEHNRSMFMLYYIFIILVNPAHLQSGLTSKVIARFFKRKVNSEILFPIFSVIARSLTQECKGKRNKLYKFSLCNLLDINRYFSSLK